MNELNKEQIIKAWECCNIAEVALCDKCPYADVELADNENCSARMALDTIALIRRLTDDNTLLENNLDVSRIMQREAQKKLEKAEHDRDRYAQRIKTLDAENTDWKSIAEQYQKQFEDCYEEKERLERICHSYALQYGTATDKEVFLAKERAATARYMRGEIELRCIEGGIYPAFVAGVINRITNEIINGENKH